jgi:hypothetical protein
VVSGGHPRSGYVATPDGVTLLLPSDPVTEPAPAWPLDPPPSEREAAVWGDLWQMPQSVAWRKLNMIREGGLHCRRFCEVEKPGAPATLCAHARGLADDPRHFGAWYEAPWLGDRRG